MKRLIAGHLLIWASAIVIGCASAKPCLKYETITETEYVRTNERVEVPVTKVRKICIKN